MEASGNRQNMLETTVSYKAWARLTPTLTHIVTYELVTSGAEDGTMSVLLTLFYKKAPRNPELTGSSMGS